MRLNMEADPATLRDGFKPVGELVVAARVSGTANSAFPNGPPAGASAAPDALKVSSKPINVVVIADSDMLADFMWGQARNFFGQSVFQPFANNGELVWNALDNLAGSNDLISIRGRASYSRPFERVEALRRNAESQFHAKEEQLENELNQTEETLSKLQSAQPKGNEAMLSSDQANEIERFQGEKLRIRKELRAVKSGLENNIKALGMWMKFINIVLVPLVFAGVALVDCRLASTSPPCHCHAAQGDLGMMRNRTLTLAIAAAVVLIAGLWLAMHRSSESGQLDGGIVFTDLTPALGEIAEVRLSKGDGSRTTLRKDGQGWTVVERNYPADPARVRELVLGLTNLRIIEHKTSDPANYPKLGVEPTESPTATGTAVEVVAGQKTWSLIVGKNAEGRGVYVRKPKDAGSVLAEPAVSADPDQKRWLDRKLVDVPGGGVHQVSVRPSGGPEYLLTRAARADADLALTPIPPGRKVASSMVVDGQAETLAAFSFDDVRALPEPAPAAADHATYKLFDGQVIEFDGHKEGDKAFVTVNASRDAALAAQFAEAAPPAPAPAATPAASPRAPGECRQARRPHGRAARGARQGRGVRDPALQV